MVKVAINGFGRIGRMVLRAGFDNTDIEFVAVNDLTDTKTLAHLLKHDSSQGKFSATVEAKENALVIDGKEVKVFSEKDPAALPWNDLGIDVVVESTGFFRTPEACQKHLDAGAKSVLLSAPAKGDIPTFVRGTNCAKMNGEKIVSNASCTTNSIAPVIRVLHEKIGIKRGFMTTIHSYTGDQRLLDAPHSDLRRARNAATNIIPTTTGAAKAVGIVLPDLKGKLDGIAVRVPTPVGSVTDLVLEMNKDITVEEVNALVKEAAEGELKGILEYSEEPLVSSDIIGNPHSGIFDAQSTMVMEGNMLKILSWYDNEWGFSNRMIEMIKKLA